MYPLLQQIPTQLTYKSPEWVHHLFVFFEGYNTFMVVW